MTPDQLRSYRGQLVARRDPVIKRRVATALSLKPRASYKVVIDEIDRRLRGHHEIQ